MKTKQAGSLVPRAKTIGKETPNRNDLTAIQASLLRMKLDLHLYYL
jgi:hypothetical protein